jgi:hypothetical protein
MPSGQQGGAQGGVGGLNGGDRAGGDARPGSSRGSMPGANRGQLSPEDVRQFGREMRERRGDAEELRQSLAQQGLDARELDALIARMRALESPNAYSNPADAARLQNDVVEGLKAFEFALRRKIEGPETAQLRLGGSDEVPAGFRALVDQYYRSLAKGRK